MTHITCRLTAKNRDQLRNPTLGNRVWATFNFTYITATAAQYAAVARLAGDIDRLMLDTEECDMWQGNAGSATLSAYVLDEHRLVLFL